MLNAQRSTQDPWERFVKVGKGDDDLFSFIFHFSLVVSSLPTQQQKYWIKRAVELEHFMRLTLDIRI
jgi:hypothetical protein